MPSTTPTLPAGPRKSIAAPRTPTLAPRTPPAVPGRTAWPEIDRLTSDADVRVPDVDAWYAGVKVILDYAVAFILLLPALVFVALAAVAVKVTSPGPVFYTQTRVGLNNRRYKIIKIRTMHHNCEAKTGIVWSQKGDDRVTAVGRFLRLTHIDELPQLLNVLRGEMSLVGPRPERPEVIRAKGLDQLVPGYRHRLVVKPGVTGLAQVQLPADSDVTGVRHKVVYDLYYAQHQSLWLDLRLLGATLFKAFLGPKWLRRVFLLPDRDAVAAVFQSKVTIPAESDPAIQPGVEALQPA